MELASNAVRLASVLFLTAIIVAAACGRADKGRTESASAATRAGANGEKYPEPRWPSYFKPPKSVDDLMDAARSFVRNQSGLQGKGMGILQPGDQVLIVANNDADPMVLDAIKRPRGEAAGGAGGPGGEDADTGAATSTDYRSRNAVGEGIKKYLTAHPEVRGVFWGQGGSTGLRRQLYPMSDKFLGTFVTDNVYTLQSQMSTYPGDVWQLAEEQLLEPLVFVD